MAKPKQRCECFDLDHDECTFFNRQCINDATTLVCRVDMDDRSGTWMCQECASNALESGLFREVKNAQD